MDDEPAPSPAPPKSSPTQPHRKPERHDNDKDSDTQSTVSASNLKWRDEMDRQEKPKVSVGGREPVDGADAGAAPPKKPKPEGAGAAASANHRRVGSSSNSGGAKPQKYAPVPDLDLLSGDLPDDEKKNVENSKSKAKVRGTCAVAFSAYIIGHTLPSTRCLIARVSSFADARARHPFFSPILTLPLSFPST